MKVVFKKPVSEAIDREITNAALSGKTISHIVVNQQELKMLGAELGLAPVTMMGRAKFTHRGVDLVVTEFAS